MRACWQCKRIFDLFLELHWLTGAHAHLDVARPAECAARDGNGKAKQGKKGEGKEKVTDHATPLSMYRLVDALKCLSNMAEAIFPSFPRS